MGEKDREWSSWVNEVPGYAVRGAACGGALGWLYDKARRKDDKESKTARRMAIAAILGAIIGAEYKNVSDGK